MDNELYSDQLKLDLAMNVYKNKRWGCYVFHKLDHGQEIAVQKAVLCRKITTDEEVELNWIQRENNEDSIEMTDMIYVYYAAYPKNILLQRVIAEELDVS